MEKDPVLEKYKNEGFGKNAFGWYFNPWIDEYDESYDPHNDPEYNKELNNKNNNINKNVEEKDNQGKKDEPNKNDDIDKNGGENDKPDKNDDKDKNSGENDKPDKNHDTDKKSEENNKIEKEEQEIDDDKNQNVPEDKEDDNKEQPKPEKESIFKRAWKRIRNIFGNRNNRRLPEGNDKTAETSKKFSEKVNNLLESETLEEFNAKFSKTEKVNLNSEEMQALREKMQSLKEKEELEKENGYNSLYIGYDPTYTKPEQERKIRRKAFASKEEKHNKRTEKFVPRAKVDESKVLKQLEKPKGSTKTVPTNKPEVKTNSDYMDFIL